MVRNSSSIKNIYSAYTSRPMSFIFPLVAFIYYGVVMFFLTLFLYMNTYPLLFSFNAESYGPVLFAIYFIIFLIGLSGLKGGMMKGIYAAVEGKGRFDTESFITYSINKSLSFFFVYLVIFILNSIPAGLLGYLIYVNLGNFLAVAILLITLLFFLFLMNYFIFYSAASLVVNEGISAPRAIIASIKTSFKEPLSLIKPYVLYLMVVVTLLIPLINVFTLFVLYPIAVGYALMKYREESGRFARYL